MSDNNRKIITDAITRMLARREHARTEIIRKLSEKGLESAAFLSILQEFTDADIQSDARYAEMRVRSCIAKGQGARRIRQELVTMKVDESAIQLAFEENSPDWFELALLAKTKRFGAHVASEAKDKAKQIRFLQYRGFGHEEIQYALNPH